MTSILLACDHAGSTLKRRLLVHMNDWDQPCLDLGVHDPMESVDYPDLAHQLCTMIEESVDVGYLGVLICGSGIGMSIVANRYRDVRCALVTSVEMARLARMHNNANVLALGARMTSEDDAIAIVDAFFGTAYERGRHDARLAKINK